MPMARTLCDLVLLAASIARADDWPGWRGPHGAGDQRPAKNLPLTWGGKNNENILWKTPLPGIGGKARRIRTSPAPSSGATGFS